MGMYTSMVFVGEFGNESDIIDLKDAFENGWDNPSHRQEFVDFGLKVERSVFFPSCNDAYATNEYTEVVGKYGPYSIFGNIVMCFACIKNYEDEIDDFIELMSGLTNGKHLAITHYEESHPQWEYGALLNTSEAIEEFTTNLMGVSGFDINQYYNYAKDESRYHFW